MSALGPALLWALVLAPAAVGGGLAVGGRRADRVAAPVSAGTALVVLGCACAVAVERPQVGAPFVVADLALAVDGLGALVVPAVALVTLLVVGWTVAGGRDEERVAAAPGRVHGFLLLFSAAVLLTATATTLPALLLGWEVMGAMSYALIGAPWREHEPVDAGLTAFLTTRAADLGLYAAVAAAVAGGAGLALADLPAAGGPWLHVAAAGVLVAALGKAAQLPFSFWLSRAMEGPSPVSALLHSAAMVAMGAYLLLRTADLLAVSGWAAPAAAWVGALTALVLGVVAVLQSDLKQALAASTASQLGFVVLAAGSVGAAGAGAVTGGAVHLVAHASTKAALFLAAGVWLQVLGTRALASLRGAARRTPAVGAAAVVAALALAGVAPLSLWATKDVVLAAAGEVSPWLEVVGLAAAVAAAAYAGRIAVTVLVREPSGAGERRGTGRVRVPAGQSVAVGVLAAGSVVLGVLAVTAVLEPLSRAVAGAAPPEPATVQLVLTAGLAVLVVAVLVPLVRRDAVPSPAWATSWLGLGDLAHRGVVRPVLALAQGCARVDDRVLDRGVTALALAVTGGAGRAARADDRVVDGAVEAAATGATGAAGWSSGVDLGVVDRAVERVGEDARRLGRAALRPQGGRVDSYYVQLVVALAVLLALSVLALVVV
ncbi:proton-conducting transporter transmembrane domain-containing protein [Aquipuribacter sp. SD81]|uniref:proton-conducting transporter transmembrane domain-containing protein n=1 Tax=Aquipuribacter sp. SD81 TaxID=3127703 RepID=UPI00301683AD